MMCLVLLSLNCHRLLSDCDPIVSTEMSTVVHKFVHQSCSCVCVRNNCQMPLVASAYRPIRKRNAANNHFYGQFALATKGTCDSDSCYVYTQPHEWCTSLCTTVDILVLSIESVGIGE